MVKKMIIQLDDMLKPDLLIEANKRGEIIQQKDEEILKLREISDPVIIAENASLKEELIDYKEQTKLLKIQLEKLPVEADDLPDIYKKSLKDLITLIKQRRVDDRAVSQKIQQIERFLK